MKKIAILGSTGSIGTQTLEVVRANKDIEVTALAAGSNIDLLEKQIREFSPKIASASAPEAILHCSSSRSGNFIRLWRLCGPRKKQKN